MLRCKENLLKRDQIPTRKKRVFLNKPQHKNQEKGKESFEWEDCNEWLKIEQTK